MSVNVNVTGRLGQDAEMRYMPDGKAVTNFSVATNGWENGEKTTHWVRCALFGERAEKLNQYLTKGTIVAVIGTLKMPKTFTRQDGTVGVNTEVMVGQLELHGGRDESTESQSQTEEDADYEEDDIPF